MASEHQGRAYYRSFYCFFLQDVLVLIVCLIQMDLVPVTPLIRAEPLSVLVRARHVLTFLLHFYVHSLPSQHSNQASHIIIPSSLATPLLEISRALDAPPVLTYADTETYNFSMRSYTLDVDELCSEAAGKPVWAEDMFIQTTFTGTEDESHFYLTSLNIELEGTAALKIMQSIISIISLRPSSHSTSREAAQTLALLLRALSTHIHNMGLILDGVRDHCDPRTFYDVVRPWFIGCTASQGWIFELAGNEAEIRALVDGNPWIKGGSGRLWEAREMAGSSAAQSSIIQALDVFLGIEGLTHELSKPSGQSSCSAFETSSVEFVKPGPAKVMTTNGYAGPTGPAFPVAVHGTQKSTGNFLRRMRDYLPLSHRLFLEALGKDVRGLRSWVRDSGVVAEDGKAVVEAYNAAVEELKGFRTRHVRIATLYIVNQERRLRQEEEAGRASLPKQTERMTGISDITGKVGGGAGGDGGCLEQHEVTEVGEVKGTGGTSLMPFLKGVRDRTGQGALPLSP